MIYAGIDAGSRTNKIVLIDPNMRVLAYGISDQGIRQDAIAKKLMDEVLRSAKLKRKDICRTVATGYSRDAISSADDTITEITCHAMGVLQHVPGARTVIDIGGQDSKLIRVESGGRVRDFVMNDRCAAGTGRFLEIVAARLEIKMKDISRIVQAARRASSISSTCVVFAETEIIGLLASGEKPGNILAGVLKSIASRILAMAGRAITDPVVFTGGVALIPGMARALEKSLQHGIAVCPAPQFTGALGAALLAKEKWRE